MGLQAGLDNQVAGEDRDLTIGVAELEGDKSQDEVAARGVYENTLYAHHATTRQLAAQQSNSLLDLYQAAYAAADALWSVQNRDALEAFEEDVTGRQITAVTSLAGNDYTLETQSNLAAVTVAPNLSSGMTSLATAEGVALTDLGVDVHVAYSSAIVSGIALSADFSVEFAVLEKVYNDAVADSHVVWTASVANAEAAYFVSAKTPTDENARIAARAAADDIRAAAKRTAYVDNVGDVGDVCVEQAGLWGDVGVTLATEGSDAHLTFIGRENTAATNYVTALGGADSQLLSLVSQAEVTASVALASFGVATSSSIGAATLSLLSAWGTAFVTRATSVASAETDYHTGTTANEASRWTAYAAAVNTPLSGFQAAEAVAYAQWVLEMGGAYQDFATGNASAWVDQESQQRVVEIDQHVAQANNAVPFTQSTGNASRTLDVTNLSDLYDGVAAGVELENALTASLTAVDKEILIDYAMADKQFLIDLYAAQRDYQVAEALEETGANDDRKLAWADARLSRATSRADADLTWKQVAAPVISAYVINDATAMKGVATQLAANEVAYDLGVTAATVALRNQDSSALADFQTDSSVVQGDFMMAKAGARTDWWLAEYEASVVALAGFSVAMGTPWAQHKAEQAVARRDWWLAQEPLYLAWMDQTAGDDTAFETDCGDALVDRSAARGTADGAIYGTMATAESAQVVSGAEADRVYASTLAGAYPTYQQAVATADRAYDVAVAVAERALELGGCQGDYDAALASARAARAGAQRSAADVYATASIAAEGDWKVRLAEADLAYAQAVGAARVDFVEAYGAAELAYVTEVADARVTRVTNVATADATYFVQESASLEAALAARSLTHPSPWATHHVAQKAARADATAIVAPARAAHDIALAEATRELEIAQIEARIALDVALTDAEVADWVASAAAAVDRVVDEHDTYVALATLVGAGGVRQARAAAGEDQPDDTPPDLDPGLAADEAWDPADMEDYDTASDDAADPGSIHFCSMTQEDDGPQPEIPEGTNYIVRTWWYSAEDGGSICFNDRYFTSEKASTYISHSECHKVPIEGVPEPQSGHMYFELVKGEWIDGKAQEIEREPPLPYTNSVGTPELRENFNRIEGEVKAMAVEVALNAAEAAMYLTPGPEELAFTLFWEYAVGEDYWFVLVDGRRFLCKGGKLLTGKALEESASTLKRWSRQAGRTGERVAPDFLKHLPDASETALKKAGKSVAPNRGAFDLSQSVGAAKARPDILPSNARSLTGKSGVEEIFRRLDKYHGIDKNLASDRLHAIKKALGYAPDDDLLFDLTGNVFDPRTREWIGSLTQGGAKGGF